MFEQEIELEKRSSSIVPLLLILALAGVIIGTGGYWVVQAKKVLTPQEATAFVGDILKAQGAVTLRFHTGEVKASINEKPRDPHYKLLEKAGLVKVVAPKKGEIYDIALTPKGEKELTAFPEFQKSKEKDGSELLMVPLARRKLVQVSKVTMNSPSVAKVEYTWKWETTPLGDLFDATSPEMKKFNIWDTQALIDKYGANFYHGDVKKSALTLVKTDSGGWRVMND
ncbi:MAG: hypothetical protein ACR2IF_15340 [Terriglobales bacterium]